MSDEDAIHNHLDEEPYDWTARLVLADLLEEQGREKEARFQRWAGKIQCSAIDWHKQKREYPASGQPLNNRWRFFSDLPKTIEGTLGKFVMEIEKYSDGVAPWSQGWDTRVEAEEVLRKTMESVNYQWRYKS